MPRLVKFALALLVLVFRIETTASAQAWENLSADSLYHRGLELLAEGSAESRKDAIDLFHRAIGSKHDFAPVYAALSNAYRSKAPWDGGDRSWIDPAIAFGEKAVFLAPDDASARLALGQAYLAKRWYRQALQHFQRAYELQPNAENASMLGWMGIEMGEWDVVVRHFERVQALADTTSADAAFHLAWAWRVLGDNERAEPLIRRVLNVYPDLRCGNSILVFIHLQNGAPSRAIEHADALLARDPDNPVFLSTAGLAYWYTGRDSVAQTHFEKAIANSPAGERVLAGCWGTYVRTPLGDILWRAGAYQRARELLDHSIEGYEARLREAGEGWGYYYDLARIYASMGMKEMAYHRLREAVRFGWSEIYLAEHDPMLGSLRAEPEYNHLMAQVEQRLEQQRTREAARH